MRELDIPREVPPPGGAGLLICAVGFLAWAVPFTNLTATIDPLVLAIRSLCLNAVADAQGAPRTVAAPTGGKFHFFRAQPYLLPPPPVS